MPTVLEYNAKRKKHPEPKPAAVVTELDPDTRKYKVRVLFKGESYPIEGDYSSLEEAHAAGDLKLVEVGYIPGYPDSYR